MGGSRRPRRLADPGEVSHRGPSPTLEGSDVFGGFGRTEIECRGYFPVRREGRASTK